MREGAGGRGASRSWRGRTPALARLLPAWRKALAVKGFLRLPAGCPQPYPHFPGTTRRLFGPRWAFLDHLSQVLDVQGKSRAALILSSCLSTECWDKCPCWRVCWRQARDSSFRRWISAPEIGQTVDCAFFDRHLQVPGMTGFFAPAPQLSSSFSTVGGDIVGPRAARTACACSPPRGAARPSGGRAAFFWGGVGGQGGRARGVLVAC